MSTEQIQDIPIDQIEAKPQVRKQIDERAVRGILLTIATVGVLAPIRVRKGEKKFIIVDGEQRFRAAKQAGWKTIPGIVEQQELIPANILAKQLIANCQRSDLNPIDKGQGIKDFMEAAGLNATDAAQRLGLSNADVTRHLKLLSLPTDIQNRIAIGEIPASAGPELARVEDPAEQAKLAAQLASGALTRDGLAATVKSRQRTPSAGGAGLKRATALLGHGRTVSVVAEELNLERFIECLMTTLAEARKVRARGVELSTFLKILKDQNP
jgi:ParB family transcriptional regulator, chromosome partitioning protein